MTVRMSVATWLAIGAAGVTGCALGTSGLNTTPEAVAAADSAVRGALAAEQAIDARTFPPRTVGVAPFQIHSPDSRLHVLGFGLADLLMTDLARSAQVQVVDRLRVDALLREMELVESGVVDSTRAPRFGRLLGARRIVLGSMTTLDDDRARLDGRIGDVVTGEVEATDAGTTTLNDLLDAEKALAYAVFDQLGVVLTPAERALVEQRPTRSLAALLAYSRGVRAEARLDFRQAAQEYREAAREDPDFGNASASVQRVESDPSFSAAAPAPTVGPSTPIVAAGSLALQAVNTPTMPPVATAADPAFRQRLAATIIIILTLP